MKNNTYYKSAFTLIELLVVISVISLLASVVLSSITSTRTKARDTERISELKQLANAIEQYRLGNENYPATDGWIESGGIIDNSVVANDYLSDRPEDPTPNKTNGDSGINYYYMYYRGDFGTWSSGNDLNKYCLYARLESPSTQQELTFLSAPFKPGSGSNNFGMNYALCSL